MSCYNSNPLVILVPTETETRMTRRIALDPEEFPDHDTLICVAVNRFLDFIDRDDEIRERARKKLAKR